MAPQLQSVAALALERQPAALAISKPIQAAPEVAYEQEAAARVGVFTRVDVEIQELLSNFLRGTWPFLSILAEEETGRDSDAQSGQEYCAVLDPIDGTKSYLAGGRKFCHIVSLMQGKQMLASLVYSHVREQLFTAVAGGGAQVVRPGAAPERIRVAAGDSRVFLHHVRIRPEDLAEVSRLGYDLVASTQNANDILNMLANGARAFVSFQPVIHDVWSPAMIVREAGGWLGDWLGREPVFLGKSRIPHLFLAQSERDARRVLPALRTALDLVQTRQRKDATG